MATLEELFQQFKQLPDWERYPMPEVFYEHFKVPKPKQSLSVVECITYQPPPYQSLNENGKTEIRGPVEGGVREIKEFAQLPVEVKMITDQIDDDSQQDSEQTMLNRPTEGTNSETQPELGHQSLNPSCVVTDTVPDVPCHDAECNPASPKIQND